MQSATDRMSVHDLLLITQDHPVKAVSQIASIVQKVVPKTFHQHKLNSVVFLEHIKEATKQLLARKQEVEEEELKG